MNITKTLLTYYHYDVFHYSNPIHREYN